jgi:DNA-binding response OmpR family regulator
MSQILLVDDDPDILDALQFVLEDTGYPVKTTQYGEYAEKLPETKELPQLIILDVLLSGKDGSDICFKLKQNEKTKHIPIIMISAHPNIKDTVLSAGADAFLPKPFDIVELLQMVKTTMNLS